MTNLVSTSKTDRLSSLLLLSISSLHSRTESSIRAKCFYKSVNLLNSFSNFSSGSFLDNVYFLSKSLGSVNKI